VFRRHWCRNVAVQLCDSRPEAAAGLPETPPVAGIRAPTVCVALRLYTGPQDISDNRILSYRGVALLGRGFVLEPDEAERLFKMAPHSSRVLKRFRNGRDLTDTPRELYVIDFGLADEDILREYPIID
jgi:hypothetical protein